MGTIQSSSGGGQGAFPKPKITRMRMLDSNQDMLEMRGSAGLPGIKRPRSQVQEEQLPDGSWSLDAVYGTLEGNEAAARQRMAYLQRQENPAMGGRDRGMEDVRRESAVPVNPYNRNNDARGESFGMDYGRKRFGIYGQDIPRRNS